MSWDWEQIERWVERIGVALDEQNCIAELERIEARISALGHDPLVREVGPQMALAGMPNADFYKRLVERRQAILDLLGWIA